MEFDGLIRPVCAGWKKKLKRAREFKKTEFGDAAREAMMFFDGPLNFMWDKGYANGKDGFLSGSDPVVPPAFRMTLNRVSDCVQLFAPNLYPSNPYRVCELRNRPQLSQFALIPRDQPLQAAQMQLQQLQMSGVYQQLAMQEELEAAQRADGASILEGYLNYTPNELDSEWHIRRAIDEAIIKGMGTLWSESVQPPGFAHQVVGSFYDSVDNLLLDPDAEIWEDIGWVARERCRDYQEVEDEFGLPRDTLKKCAGYEDVESQSEGDDKQKRSDGDKRNLLKYTEIWSKRGFGHRHTELPSLVKEQFDQFGPFCRLVICDHYEFPLNFTPDVMQKTPEEAFMQVQWPIPFWADGRWPFTPIMFHEKPGSIWPISHIRPGIGQLRALNWIMSYLMTKARATCTTFVGVIKAAGEKLVEIIEQGSATGIAVYQIEELLNAKSIGDLVTFNQPPSMDAALYEIADKLATDFERAVGLHELAYGMASTQSRSATDVSVRNQNAGVRVNDMIRKTNRALTQLAKNEALAARWLLTPEDIAPILGQAQAFVWEQKMLSVDLETMVREYDFRIEASDYRVPSKETQVEQSNASLQVLGPLVTPFAQMGIVDPLNALIGNWCKAQGIEAGPFMIPPPPPPPEGQPPPPEQGPPQQ